MGVWRHGVRLRLNSIDGVRDVARWARHVPLPSGKSMLCGRMHAMLGAEGSRWSHPTLPQLEALISVWACWNPS